jgi:hypothetical protein
MMKITSKLLRAKRACKAQVDLFKALGGDTLELTEALCVKHASEFDWAWAADNLLSAPAWAEYDRVRASAGAEYDRVVAPARAEYDRVVAPASAKYNRVVASAFWRANNGQA